MAAYELGDKSSDRLSIEDAIGILSDHRELTPELATSISSPGFLRLLANYAAPIAVSVLYNVALATDAAAGQPPPRIEIVNSASTQGDECAVLVQEETEGAMRLMRLEEWHKACLLARRAKEQNGLESSMKAHHHLGVEPSHDRR